MPVILPEDAWPAWLGEQVATDEELKGLLKPVPVGQLQMWPVNKRVGNVKNDGAELIAPLAM